MKRIINKLPAREGAEAEGASRLPGMTGDVYFGDAETPLSLWRYEIPPDEEDDDEGSDDLDDDERASVVGMIGFDPGGEDAREERMEEKFKDLLREAMEE